MAEKRRLQGEIERTLKKVHEGRSTFKETLDKFESATNHTQKEKHEADLKKDIKKLQRFRDSIKTWLTSPDVKDKALLTDIRKLIESDMERFKVIEKETKTKAYSKEGLFSDQKKDPMQKEKDELLEWLRIQICKLQKRAETCDFDMHNINAKKKRNADRDRMGELGQRLGIYRSHISKQESLLRLLDNDKIDLDKVRDLRTLFEEFLSNPDMEMYKADQGMFMYEDMNIDQLSMDLTMVSDLELSNNSVSLLTDSMATASLLTPSKVVTDNLHHHHQPAVGTAITETIATQPDSHEESSSRPLTKDRPSTKANKHRAEPTNINSKTVSITSTPLKSCAAAILEAPDCLFSPNLNNTTTTTDCATVTLTATATSRQCLNNNDDDNDSVVTATHSLETQLSNSPLLETVSYFSSPPTSSSLPLCPDTANVPPHHHQSQPFSLPSAVTTTLPPSLSTSTQELSSSSTNTVNNYRLLSSSPPPPPPSIQLSSSFQQQQQQQQQQQAPPPISSSLSQASYIADSNNQPSSSQHSSFFDMHNNFIPHIQQQQQHQQQQQQQQQQNEMNYQHINMVQRSNPPQLQSLRTPSNITMGKDNTFDMILEPGDAMSPFRNHNFQMNDVFNNQVIAMEHGRIKQPLSSDSEKARMIIYKNEVPVPDYFPKEPVAGCDTEEYYMRLDSDTLFFIFYYFEGTKAQYLAAKALKRMSWRFHTGHMCWFQRHEEPKQITDNSESGTYIFYDFESMSRQKKENFTFSYNYLEDKDF